MTPPPTMAEARAALWQTIYAYRRAHVALWMDSDDSGTVEAWDNLDAALDALVAAAQQEEREACAMICDSRASVHARKARAEEAATAIRCADDIRARPRMRESATPSPAGVSTPSRTETP